MVLVHLSSTRVRCRPGSATCGCVVGIVGQPKRANEVVPERILDQLDAERDLTTPGGSPPRNWLHPGAPLGHGTERLALDDRSRAVTCPSVLHERLIRIVLGLGAAKPEKITKQVQSAIGTRPLTHRGTDRPARFGLVCMTTTNKTLCHCAGQRPPACVHAANRIGPN